MLAPSVSVMIRPRTARAARQLVERPGANRAPVAFRIWAFGPNKIDDGQTVVFSQRSAEALLTEQAARGRLYSFDFDHRSMMLEATPQAGKASGWHVLEVRQDENGKPELWAASCDWTADARAGHEADPPEWRYFSPTYLTDPTTREVVSYIGCALTNNPLTHGIPALASAVARPLAKPASLALVRARCSALVLRARQNVPRMSSALARLEALRVRASKLEQASAVRGRASSPPSRPQQRPMQKDRVTEELARAERTILRSLGRDIPMPRLPTSGPVADIEEAERNTLRSIRK